MNKSAVIKKVIEQLASELESFDRAARAAHAEATHEQSKAEDKYDTRGLEAAYLARGQSRQAGEILESIAAFQKLSSNAFADGAAIELGAIVELESGEETAFYLMGPRAGGTEITQNRKSIMVITPQSPLGERLLGKPAGAQFEINGQKWRIKSVL